MGHRSVLITESWEKMNANDKMQLKLKSSIVWTLIKEIVHSV